MKKRVLVVDDSALVRNILTREISNFSEFQVIGTAVDPYDAREKIFALNPDILTLDLEMPRMDGLSFLSKLMRFHPMPVIVVSSQAPEGSRAALTALAMGAVAIVPKPSARFSAPDVSRNLMSALRASAEVRPERLQPVPSVETASVGPLRDPSQRIVAIGASTGGTQAIETIMRAMPSNGPGTVIVQHMPGSFISAFADRLNKSCGMEVREARDQDQVMPGVALLAAGDKHMILERSGDGYKVRIKRGPLIHYQRPSVDVLFHSVASSSGPWAVGVILTGMGSDGARGLLAMHSSGAHTIAQDEKSCAIYGMPRKAIELGAVDEVLPLSGIAGSILTLLSSRSRRMPRWTSPDQDCYDTEPNA